MTTQLHGGWKDLTLFEKFLAILSVALMESAIVLSILSLVAALTLATVSVLAALAVALYCIVFQEGAVIEVISPMSEDYKKLKESTDDKTTIILGR